MHFFILTTLLLAAGPSPSAADKRGGEDAIEHYELTGESVYRKFHVRVAARNPVEIAFSEKIEGLGCGDCQIVMPRDSATAVKERAGEPPRENRNLYRLEEFASERAVLLRLLKKPGLQPDHTEIPLEVFQINLTVHLATGHTVFFLVEAVERASQATGRMEFVLPGKELLAVKEQERLDELKRSGEEQCSRRVAGEADQSLLRALAEAHHCEKRSARTRHDGVVIEVNEVCWFGNRVFVPFSIENRSPDPFTVEDVTVLAGRGGDLRPVAMSGKPFVARPQIETSTAGALSFVEEAHSPSSNFRLSIVESGGRKREITLEF
jgi:hypothetical protein